MSTIENVFSVLDGDEATTNDQSNAAPSADKVSELPSIAVPEEASASDSAWTAVQSSTRRKLTPQWSISRQDLGVDSPNNRAAQAEIIKKKGN